MAKRIQCRDEEHYEKELCGVCVQRWFNDVDIKEYAGGCIKKMLNSTLLSVFFVFFLAGCTTRMDSVHNFIPLPIPSLEPSIHSAEYFEKKEYVIADSHNIECSINRQKQLASKNPFTFRASDGTTTKDETIHYYNFLGDAKQIGGNRYSISLKHTYPITRQKDYTTCWAHSIKNIVKYETKKDVPLKNVIQYVQGSNEHDRATYLNILYKMGMTNVTTSECSSLHLLKALSEQHPVMMGYKHKEDVFHAVVIVGATFSFVDTNPAPEIIYLNPFEMLEAVVPMVDIMEDFAFRTFIIADPATGKITEYNAEEFDDKIQFLLSFKD